MRKLYGPEQKRFFFTQVPDEITTEVAAIIVREYASAAAMVEERWGSWEAKDALPHVRRADIENALSLLGAKFKGVKVGKKPNAINTAWHTEVYSGSVVLTQSKTEGPDVDIRPAEFRTSLAADCRMNMPWAQTKDPDEDADVLWACVVHGPSDKPNVPAYIKIVFPLPDGSWQTSITLPVAQRREVISEAVARIRREAFGEKAE